MNRNSLLICFGLLLVAAAIVIHAQNGRYSFAYSASGNGLIYAKLDTRTGEAWLCGSGLDSCIPMTNKATFQAYADRVKSADQIATLKRTGFSDDEIKQWMETRKSQP